MLTLIVFMSIVIILFVAVNSVNNRGISQVNVASAQDLITNGATLIDVRTAGEFNQGHIKGAKLIPLSEIASRINEIVSLKDSQILIYCHAGSRSIAACRIMRKNGFTKVSNLQGGISSWNREGKKIVKGK